MTIEQPPIRVGDTPELEAFLADRIYEFNADATGFHDGESFSATHNDAAGDIRAGICGYTWGGCCYIQYLWVHEAERGKGLGTALLRTAEEHARSKRCIVVFVATHSFQAPDFYARNGYEAQTLLRDHPVGFSSMILSKRLHRDGA
jgi:GNAT superfamily N-acetyltransferase